MEKVKKTDNQCPVERVLGRLAGKWTLVLLKHLSEKNSVRFNDLSLQLHGISPRTLSSRLKELEKMKLVSRKKFNETPPRVEYSLTAKGRDLFKCFQGLHAWAHKHGV